MIEQQTPRKPLNTLRYVKFPHQKLCSEYRVKKIVEKYHQKRSIVDTGLKLY